MKIIRHNLSNDQQYYTAMIHNSYAYAATHNVMHSKKIFLNHSVEHWATERFSFSCVSCRIYCGGKIMKIHSLDKEFLLQHRDHEFFFSIQWFLLRVCVMHPSWCICCVCTMVHGDMWCIHMNTGFSVYMPNIMLSELYAAYVWHVCVTHPPRCLSGLCRVDAREYM